MTADELEQVRNRQVSKHWRMHKGPSADEVGLLAYVDSLRAAGVGLLAHVDSLRAERDAGAAKLQAAHEALNAALAVINTSSLTTVPRDLLNRLDAAKAKVST